MGPQGDTYWAACLNRKQIDIDRTAPPCPLRRRPPPLFPPLYTPIPFIGDAASPPDLAHPWEYVAMLSEDARKALDRGDDWVESATDNSWINPG